MRIRAGILIEHFLACVRECRDIISHLDQAEFDQFAQMIWVGRQQSPLRLDVSKRPNEVDGPKGLTPDMSPICHSLHKNPILIESTPAGGSDSGVAVERA